MQPRTVAPSNPAVGRRSRRRPPNPAAPGWGFEPSGVDNVLDFDELRRERVRREREEARSEREARDRARREEEALDRMLEEPLPQDTATRRRPARVATATRAKCPPCHWGLFALTLLFAVLSVPLVYSASTAIALDNHSNPSYFLVRQLGFVVIGVLILVAMSRVPGAKVRSVVWSLYGIALLGLLATKFTPLGLTQGNVERWVKFGPLPLQFSELAKIALIGVMADFWSRAAVASHRSMWPWAAALAMSLPIAALVFIQPHLSAALLLFVVPFAVAFYAGVPFNHMVKLLTPVLLLVVAVVGMCRAGAMPLLKPYQQERIAKHFFSDGTDNQDANYQALQGQRALMRGGIMGVGIGNSYYKHGQLPAPHTDFILAILGEEWGLLGMVVLLGGYGALIFFCFQIGHSAGKPFESLMCAGIGTLLAVQVICNAGVVTGVMPVTGMPLPLLSYGGSGLLCTLLGLGLVLSVSRQVDSDDAASEDA
jgi:cell division protein FtsW